MKHRRHVQCMLSVLFVMCMVSASEAVPWSEDVPWGFKTSLTGSGIQWEDPVFIEDWEGHSATVMVNPLRYSTNYLLAGQGVIVQGEYGGGWSGHLWASIDMERPFTLAQSGDLILSGSLGGFLDVGLQTGFNSGQASVLAYAEIVDVSDNVLFRWDFYEVLKIVGHYGWTSHDRVNIAEQFSENFHLLDGIYLFRQSLTVDIAANNAAWTISRFTAVPEPSSLLLMGVGMAAFVLFRSRALPKGMS